MKRLLISSSLQSALLEYSPSSLGPLWLSSITAVPTEPGFFIVNSACPDIDDSIHKPHGGKNFVVFVDPTKKRPIYILQNTVDPSLTARDFIDQRLLDAFTYRESMGYNRRYQSAYRLVNGRRDCLPGLSIDVYTQEHAVISLSSTFWFHYIDDVLIRFCNKSLPSLKSIAIVNNSSNETTSYSSDIIFGDASISTVNVLEARKYNHFDHKNHFV